MSICQHNLSWRHRTESEAFSCEIAVESFLQGTRPLGLGSIVEFSQANLQKTEADLEDTDAHYQYLVTQIVLAYQMGITR
jgi:hypothetical protein